VIEGASSTEEEYPVIADNTPTIEVTTNKNAICKGSLDTDESYENMDFIFYGTQKEHNYTFTYPISEGQHTVYVRCKDELNNIMQNSLLVTFKIDTAAPVITVVAPGSKVVGEFTELKITVNENAECRYEDDDDDFDDMDDFDTITGDTFITSLSELDDDTYTYYIKCKDQVGNIAEKSIEFVVEIPPKAEIILEKESPLPKGTFELTLIPSKKLRSVPELSYKFTDDDTFTRDINLIKDGNYYKGYIIIEDQKTTRSGVFSFRGYDLNGNEGTEITKGAIFLVDTIAPPVPESVQAIATDDGIKLEWYYDDEKPSHFNIYRSMSQGLSYIDYYKSTTSNSYLDEDIEINQLYYYRIAAVDKAGNIGKLSKEINVYAKSGTTVSSPVTNKNPPSSQTRDWKEKTEQDVDSLLIDLEWAENNLKEQSTKESIVDKLSLVKQVLDAISDIEKLKSQLQAINIVEISDTDLREMLSKADALVARTKKTTPQKVEIIKSTDVIQATTESDVELAVSEYVTGNFSEKQIKDYTKKMVKVNKNVRVETVIKTFRIEYLDNSDENRVYVEKTFSYENPEQLNNVIVIEIIPKTVAGDVSSIDIKNPDYTVVNPDPVIMWQYPKLSFDKESHSYVLLSDDNSESAKTTKTIVLIYPKDIIKESSVITGFTTFFSKVKEKGIEVLGVILGILVILGLAMYYLVVINEVDFGAYLEKIPFIKNIEMFKGAAPTTTKTIDTKVVEEKEEQPDLLNNQTTINVDKFAYLFKEDNPVKTIPEQYFFVKNGDVIRSISELHDVLSNMDDFTFYYHVHDNTNDFADWVETIYHTKELADLMRSMSNKEDLLNLMKYFIQKN